MKIISVPLNAMIFKCTFYFWACGYLLCSAVTVLKPELLNALKNPNNSLIGFIAMPLHTILLYSNLHWRAVIRTGAVGMGSGDPWERWPPITVLALLPWRGCHSLGLWPLLPPPPLWSLSSELGLALPSACCLLCPQAWVCACVHCGLCSHTCFVVSSDFA